MLFKERSNALLPKKHCFAQSGEMAYTFFNFLTVIDAVSLRKFRTLCREVEFPEKHTPFQLPKRWAD